MDWKNNEVCEPASRLFASCMCGDGSQSPRLLRRRRFRLTLHASLSCYCAQRTLASVTTLRAELLKQMLLDDDAGSAGRTGAAPAPGQAADADAGRPTNFSLAHEEVGHAFGVVPAALTAAARDAQRFAWGRRAQCSSSPEQEPWAVYVASDAPIVVAVAEASPSLRGRAFTAGKESGSIGNVWMQARARARRSWRCCTTGSGTAAATFTSELSTSSSLLA